MLGHLFAFLIKDQVVYKYVLVRCYSLYDG